MPNCPTCRKPVYFAEKVTALNQDWHRACLKCKQCGKTLTPGSFSEKEGIPYCNRPCYQNLFGPKGFGFGGTVESFNSYGGAESEVVPKPNIEVNPNSISKTGPK